METRLSRRTLDRLPATVRRPAYDLAGLRTGIVHLGLGAFHRAHQAAYTQPLLEADPSWGILGVSLRRAETRDALAPQDGLYTLAQRDGLGERLEIIGALTGLCVAPEDPSALVARMAHPDVRIVTLTVTEKGYCWNPATGELDETDPAILADLADPDRPRTAPGFLAAALRARRAAGTLPFTVLSCDNLPANGRTTHRVLTRFAHRLDPEFGAWVQTELACPDSMVDRIVPATTDADRARIAAMLGMQDAWPVIAEPFTQWVIEDRFPQGRPEWERTGATMVSDVRPYEDMKLRLLNASHSSIAYLGQLAGWETVADAMAVPPLRVHVSALMQETATTLHMPAGMDLDAYRNALLARFANPALRHRTAQIAMDGSQKLPQRLLAAATDRLAAGQGVDRITLGVAAWLRFVQGYSDAGAALELNDPLAARLRSAAPGSASPRQTVDGVFALGDVIPAHLAASGPFRAAVLAALECLTTQGATATLLRRQCP